jgi:hypothetical protein
MSCKTTALLASYLQDSKDTAGVMALIRDKYPRSLSTYLTQIKKQWLTLNITSDTYASEYQSALATTRSWKSKAPASEAKTLDMAIEKLQEFNAMNMQEKYTVQRSLKSRNFTGHAPADDLISKLDILPDYISELRIDGTERMAIQQKTAHALIAKSSDAMRVEASKLLTRLRLVLQSKKSNPFDCACALSCVTGRRMVEIFRTGVFTPVKNEPYACIFEGQAKKQFAYEGYKIPLLVEFDLMNDALNRLRVSKNTEDLNNSEVNLRYSSSCNTAARRLFGEARTFHTCRAVYGVLSFHTAMPHTYSLNMWLSKILGHASLGNSLNYSSIHVEHLDESDKHAFHFE